MNLPNKLTVLRVCMVPVFVVFMLWNGFGTASKYVAAAIFILASMTDWLDGYLARKNNLVTDFGKFMDPIADKLLVCSALICLVEKGALAAWIVIIIIGREFIISGFRLVASDKGVVIAASLLGKIQDRITDADGHSADWIGGAFNVAAQVLIWIAVILTVVSLVDYLVKNRSVLAGEM